MRPCLFLLLGSEMEQALGKMIQPQPGMIFLMGWVPCAFWRAQCSRGIEATRRYVRRDIAVGGGCKETQNSLGWGTTEIIRLFLYSKTELLISDPVVSRAKYTFSQAVCPGSRRNKTCHVRGVMGETQQLGRDLSCG